MMVLVALGVLLGPLSAMAYKPAPVKKPIVYTDAQNTVEVTLTPVDGYGPAEVTVKEAGDNKEVKHAWVTKIDLPATAVVSAVHKRVVVLGGRGDSGVNLGSVTIFDFEGKTLLTLDLRKHIADLEEMSKGYRKICCPFPWIHATSLTKDDAELHINVCDKKTVVIDLKALKLVGVR
jgi:hypothetical protein